VVTRERLGEIRREIQQMAAGCHNPEPDTQNDSESVTQPPPVKRMRPDGETSKNLFDDFFQDMFSDTTANDIEPDTRPIDAKSLTLTKTY